MKKQLDDVSKNSGDYMNTFLKRKLVGNKIKSVRYYENNCELCEKLYIGVGKRFCGRSCAVKVTAWNKGLRKDTSKKLQKIYGNSFSRNVSVAIRNSVKCNECVFVNVGDCLKCTIHKYGKNGYHYWCKDGKITYLHKILCVGGERGEVRHLCENNWCLNKNHLVVGTHKENMEDMMISGRCARGSRHGMAKLTPKQAIEIYTLKGGNARFIANKFDVTERNIRAIWEGLTWWRFTGAMRKVQKLSRR